MLFRSCFFGWNVTNKSPATSSQSAQAAVSLDDAMHEYEREYTLQELQKKPPRLDGSRLETYLSDIDFESIFQCDKTTFAKMTEWKRNTEKQRVGLF